MNIEKCSKPQLHNFPDMNNLNTKCLDCGKTIKQIYDEYMQYINDEGIMFISPEGTGNQKPKFIIHGVIE